MVQTIAIETSVENSEEIAHFFLLKGMAVTLIEEALPNTGDSDSLPSVYVLPLNQLGKPAIAKAERLRDSGYNGVIAAVGAETLEVPERKRLSELQVFCVPALSGPVDVVARIRQLLP